MEFSQWLQSEMDAKHITKYRLAKLSGVHQTTISNLLSGASPQIETEKKIRFALSEIDDLKKDRKQIVRLPDYLTCNLDRATKIFKGQF